MLAKRKVEGRKIRHVRVRRLVQGTAVRPQRYRAWAIINAQIKQSDLTCQLFGQPFQAQRQMRRLQLAITTRD